MIHWARSLKLSFVPLFVMGASLASAAPTAARRVHVALVNKGAVHTFLNRLADHGQQLVVTKEPVAHALESRTFDIGPGEQLYLVEHDHSAPLPGELARLGAFAVVKAARGLDPHVAFGSHKLYAEPVAAQETVVTPSLPTHIEGSILERSRLRIDIDRAFLEQKLGEFSGATPTTIDGRQVTISERRSATGRNNARAWLRQEYERLGFVTSEHRYSGGSNFVAEKAGADPTRFVVVSAHLDSVGNAGADDDGSGTISALAIAQALQNESLRYNLRIVGFDQEESGLLGSAAYARSLNYNGTIRNLVGVINIEMTGYDADDDGGFHIIDCDENTSAELSTYVAGVIQRDPLRLERVSACTNRSDHASFWRYDRPAIVISQNFFGGDSNPCYHLSCDRVDQVNFDYMTRLTTAVARATADLLVE